MNNHTTAQLKDALRILKAFKESQNFSKAVKRAMQIAIEAIEIVMEEK